MPLMLHLGTEIYSWVSMLTLSIDSGIITPTVLSQPAHETATYRCDDTRGCVMQF